jgi:hypothetical protein
MVWAAVKTHRLAITTPCPMSGMSTSEGNSFGPTTYRASGTWWRMTGMVQS